MEGMRSSTQPPLTVLSCTAPQLEEERKRQTDESLARETRGRVLAWVLLVTGGVFVGAGKWWVSLGADAHPSLEELVAARLGGVSGAGGGGLTRNGGP